MSSGAHNSALGASVDRFFTCLIVGGTSQNGNDAPTIRPVYCSCQLSAARLVRSAIPNRSSPRRRSRPSHLGARPGGCNLGRQGSTRVVSGKRTGSNFSRSAEVQNTLELPSCSAVPQLEVGPNSLSGRIPRSAKRAQLRMFASLSGGIQLLRIALRCGGT